MTVHQTLSGRLDGKVAIITGASSGMGITHAELFVAAGAQVVITDIVVDAGNALADRLGESALFVQHDVTDSDSWESVVAAGTSNFGPPTVLVNNAGVSGPLLKSAELSPADFRRTVEVDQNGSFYGIRATVPSMIEAGGGSIVNVSSAAGIAAIPNFPNAAYVASKFGVRGLTKAAAIEYGPNNIRVNSVHPGAVLTPMAEVSFEEYGAEFRAAYEQAIPMRRLATPLEISKLVLFLASDDSSYCTGSEFIADGGMLAQ